MYKRQGPQCRIVEIAHANDRVGSEATTGGIPSFERVNAMLSNAVSSGNCVSNAAICSAKPAWDLSLIHI